MKPPLLFFVLLVIVSCGKNEKEHKVVGNWRNCQPDGEYVEFKITEEYTYCFTSGHMPKAWLYKNEIRGDTLISTGINIYTIKEWETLLITIQSQDSIILRNEFSDMHLVRLKEEIPDVDSANLKKWEAQFAKDFGRRLQQVDCPDLRTEKEKNSDPIHLGTIEDNFEPLIDDEFLPEWARSRFEKYTATLERSRLLFPNYWEADFSGDGTVDIAVFVKNRLNDKQGILFLFAENDLMFWVGAGELLDAAGDDFGRAIYWDIFNQMKTQEVIFKDNGDVAGTREVILERPAINILEEDGSGGLIYFDGEMFTWIHQGN